jgi:riboflavin transporter FmnP
MLGGDGLYGFLMHFVATGIVAVVIGLMYARNKTRKRAVASLVTGVIVATAVMCVMNLIITPLYMGAPREAVVAMLPTAIIPFNLLKAGLNAVLTFILYKRVSGFLHRGSTVAAAERAGHNTAE